MDINMTVPANTWLLFTPANYQYNIYLFKVETLEKDVKYVQSQQ